MLNAQTLATYSFGLNLFEFGRFLEQFRTKQTLVNISTKIIPATSTEAICQYLIAKIRISEQNAK